MDLNKVMLIGNIVRDPEMRTTPNGKNVSSFSIATNRVWTDASNQKQTKAEFHNIVAWGRLAEITNQYLKKGSKIYLEGRLETRSWDDPNGIKRYRTEVIADNMIMLDRAGSAGVGASAPADKRDDFSQPASPNRGEPEPKNNTSSEEEINIEDIPF